MISLQLLHVSVFNTFLMFTYSVYYYISRTRNTEVSNRIHQDLLKLPEVPFPFSHRLLIPHCGSGQYSTHLAFFSCNRYHHIFSPLSASEKNEFLAADLKVINHSYHFLKCPQRQILG